MWEIYSKWYIGCFYISNYLNLLKAKKILILMNKRFTVLRLYFNIIIISWHKKIYIWWVCNYYIKTYDKQIHNYDYIITTNYNATQFPVLHIRPILSRSIIKQQNNFKSIQWLENLPVKEIIKGKRPIKNSTPKKKNSLSATRLKFGQYQDKKWSSNPWEHRI